MIVDAPELNEKLFKEDPVELSIISIVPLDEKVPDWIHPDAALAIVIETVEPEFETLESIIPVLEVS